MSNNEFIVKATPAFYELIESEIKGTYTLKVIKNPNKNPEPSPEDLNVIEIPNHIELVETETKGTYDVIIKNVVLTYKVEVYKPNETQETFKGMFNSVVEELNKPYTLKRTQNIMFVELKKYFMIRRGLFKTQYNTFRYGSNIAGKGYDKYEDILNDNFSYNGKCYIYSRVSKYHPSVRYNRKDFNEYRIKFKDVKDDKRVEEWFLKQNKFYTFAECFWKEFFSTADGRESWKNFRQREGCKSNKSIFPFKIRVLYKTLNYNLTPNKYYSLFNLKYWDKTTKLTSLRGLKAIDGAWTYSDYHRRTRSSGWSFGGITASNISDWARRNGFQDELVKITNQGKKNEKKHYKKYQYGDYAEYMCKTFGGYNVNEYLLETTRVVREKQMKKK